MDLKTRARKTIGQAVEICAYTFAWFSLVNTAIIMLLGYDKVIETLNKYINWIEWSWLSLPLFILLVLIAVILVFLTEWFVIYPARQKFRNTQEVASGSPIIEAINSKPSMEQIREVIRQEIQASKEDKK